MTGLQTKPQRADAARNRARILDAATKVFAAKGPSATLTDVAELAGVGMGTVYRNFADKDELLDALVDDKVADFMRPALEAASIADPGEAFRHYLSGTIEAHARDRSLATLLFGPDRMLRFPADLARLMTETCDQLISAAIDAGELREGFTRQDTMVLGAMIGQVAAATRDHPEVWRRYAQLVVDGTRPVGSHEALSPAPLSFLDTADALGRTL
jgi:AcrR family transcriptional regulator